MSAIQKIKNTKMCNQKLDLCVIKILNNGEIKNSKPCKNCIKYIEKSKINLQYVYFSDTNGQIIKTTFEKLKKEDLCITTGMRSWKKKTSN